MSSLDKENVDPKEKIIGEKKPLCNVNENETIILREHYSDTSFIVLSGNKKL